MGVSACIINTLPIHFIYTIHPLTSIHPTIHPSIDATTGSSWVRVIPPLRGLEREVKCSWCNVTLFTLASVIHGSMDGMGDMKEMIDTLNNDCAGMANRYGIVIAFITTSSSSVRHYHRYH